MSEETGIVLSEELQQIEPIRRSILTISDSQVSRIKLLAGMMADSTLEYRKLKPGEIFIKMMKGLEVGLEPVASMDLIDVIQGKPTLKPQGMLALVHGSGQLTGILITDDGDTCTVEMKRNNLATHYETFSTADAKSMGLSGKDNWKKQPAVMRKWRAISAACRIVFPDIIQGMYITEEIAPDVIVDDTGDIVDAPIVEQPAITAPPEPAVQKMEMTTGSPEVWACTFTHMNYNVNGKGKYLGFATCDPMADHKKNKTVIRAYGRTTKIKSWLGDLAYDELNLAQYNGLTKTSEFIKMPFAVDFEYIEEMTKAKETYLKAVGIVDNDAEAKPHPGDGVEF